MRSLIEAGVIAVLIAAPLAAFAQSSEPVTRAEVRAQLVEVEKAGYDPRDWLNYPQNIQAAEARVAAEKASATGYGASSNGSSQAGQ